MTDARRRIPGVALINDRCLMFDARCWMSDVRCPMPNLTNPPQRIILRVYSKYCKTSISKIRNQTAPQVLPYNQTARLPLFYIQIALLVLFYNQTEWLALFYNQTAPLVLFSWFLILASNDYLSDHQHDHPSTATWYFGLGT
jgi:hypothetical protein